MVNRKNYLFFGLGIIILTLGISLTIQSNLGTSPFDALLVGLSKEVGLTVGSWEIIIAFLLISLNACLQRKKPEILGLVTALITGIGIDLWLTILQFVEQPDQFLSKMICFTGGLIISGIGSAIYLQTNFAPIPVDRFMLIIQELTNMNLFYSKTFIYVLFLLLAFVFKGPIGIGTILTVCLGGLILNYFMPIVETMLDSLTKQDKGTHIYKSQNHSS